MQQEEFLHRQHAHSATISLPEVKTWPYDTHIAHESVTKLQYSAFDEAKAYFIRTLFKKPLPPVLLTLHEHWGSKGYYSPRRWTACNGQPKASLIAQINISPTILLLEPKIMMSTLVHELAHHYQYVYGTPGRGGYHNREFAEIMREVGLVCSNTGKPGGRKTGDRMTHYILEGGRFENVFNTMPKEFLLPFKPHIELFGITTPNKAPLIQKDTSKKNKTKHTCLGCGAAAWGKQSLHLICGECEERMVIIEDFK